MKNLFLGELNESYWVNAIILNTKKCIFLARIREIKPSLSHIKVSVKYMHNYEKFSFQMKNKEHLFTQRWGIYTDNLDTWLFYNFMFTYALFTKAYMYQYSTTYFKQIFSVLPVTLLIHLYTCNTVWCWPTCLASRKRKKVLKIKKFSC